MSANPFSLSQPRQFIEIAKPLVERGIPVIPVQPHEKRCLLPEWQKRATTEINQIALWNAENPRFNVGAVGKPNGFLILDCDVVGLREQIEKSTGQKFPCTLVVKSAGKGAEHIYFRQTDKSRDLGNRSSMGLYDLQSVDKYVVGAGSTLDNGRAYEIVDDSPVADFPDWLADWCARNSVQERRPKQAHRDARPTVEAFDPDLVLCHYGLNYHQSGSWLITEICPVAGHKHEQSTRTGFYWDGEHFGFHCFASSCEGSEMTVGQVLRFLNQTHEPYPEPIWEDTLGEDLEMFGVDVLDDMEDVKDAEPEADEKELQSIVEEAKLELEEYEERRAEEEQAAEAMREETAPEASSGAQILAEGMVDEAQVSLVTIRADRIEDEILEWVWPGRIAKAKITWLAGKPDCGKSVVLIDLIARVTTGRDFPDKSKNEWGAQEVLLGVTEDGLGDTVKQRLRAAGADLTKVHILEVVRVKKGDTKKQRMFQLKLDLRLLKHTLKRNPNITMVCLDPITGYFGADSNSDKDIRPIMDNLAKVCNETRCTFLAIMHQNKKTDVSAIQKILGASSVAGSARIAWGFGRDPEEKDTCHMSLIKNNLSKQRSGMDYKLVSKNVLINGKQVEHPIVEWLGENELSADEQMDRERELKKGGDGGSASQRSVAKDFLTKNIEAGNDKICELIPLAEHDGISRATLYRAARDLMLKSTDAKPKRWFFADEGKTTVINFPPETMPPLEDGEAL